MGYLVFQVIRPFFSPIAWAIVFAIIFYPVYLFFKRYLRSEHLAAFFTVIVVLFLILGPVSYILYILTNELNLLLDHLANEKINLIDRLYQEPAAKRLIDHLLFLFNTSSDELKRAIASNMSQFSKDFISILKIGIGNIISVVVNFVIMCFSLFFFLKDGPSFLQTMKDYLPIPKKARQTLAGQIKGIVASTIYGGVVVAIVQGFIAGATFFILGVPLPVLWGMAVIATSFIPLFGTFLIWGPVAGYLFYHGLYTKAVIMAVVGMFGISMIDNILRPILLKGRMQMPILLIFFSIFGGMGLFGLIGFIMGPLVIALFMSLLEIIKYAEAKDS